MGRRSVGEVDDRGNGAGRSPPIIPPAAMSASGPHSPLIEAAESRPEEGARSKPGADKTGAASLSRTTHDGER